MNEYIVAFFYIFGIIVLFWCLHRFCHWLDKKGEENRIAKLEKNVKSLNEILSKLLEIEKKLINIYENRFSDKNE